MNIKPKLLTINWQDPSHPAAGGAEIHTWEVTRRLVKMGVECVLYSCKVSGLPNDEIREGIHIHRRGIRPLFNFYVYGAVRRWVKIEKPTWIIDDSNKIPFFLPWLLPSHKVLVRIQHVFGQAIFYETNFLSGVYVYLSEKLAVYSWRRVPALTFSESSRDDLYSFGIKQVGLTYHGIDLNLYQPGLPARQPALVGYLGRVKKYKGLDVLLKALHELVQRGLQVSCEIAGGGDDRSRLEQLALTWGLNKHVKFLGFVAESEKVDFYRRCTLVVNCSRKEGWGLTTIEANACGTVVVASDVHGLRDSVKDGVTGFLFPFGDHLVLADKMEILLKNPEIREKMQNDALARAQSFNWDQTALDTYKTLNSLR